MNARQQNGMYLFISLTKDGCEWQGDVFSNKWSDCLFIPMMENSQGESYPDPTIADRVERTLSAYTEGNDFRREGGNAIWIA